MKMAANIREGIINWGKLPQQRPAHLPGGIGGSVGGFRFDEIDDSLRLGKIHLPV